MTFWHFAHRHPVLVGTVSLVFLWLFFGWLESIRGGSW